MSMDTYIKFTQIFSLASGYIRNTVL